MPAGPVLAVLATEHGYFALRAREVSIGRSRSCDVSIAAPSISAQHAHMAIINGDEAHLTDHSRAGTTVNGIRVHQDSVVIRDGDEVRFGLGSPLFRYSTHPPGEHTPVFGCDQAIATEDTESQRSSCQEVAVGPDIFVPTEIEPILERYWENLRLESMRLSQLKHFLGHPQTFRSVQDQSSVRSLWHRFGLAS